MSKKWLFCSDTMVIEFQKFEKKNLFLSKISSRNSFVQRANEFRSTQTYHARKAQHLTFSTHYQPYPHHTPNALDPRPKWPHKTKIQKSKFSIFLWNPSKFRFVQKFLVAPTIRYLRGQIYWVMIFQTHYQPWAYDIENKLRWLSKLHTKSQKIKKIQISNAKLLKFSKTHISRKKFCFSQLYQ